jgi:sulfate-transporting ATPase
MAQEEKQESARQRALKDELEWVRPRPRRARPRARPVYKSYQSLVDAARDQTDRRLDIRIPTGQRLGDLVIDSTTSTKSYGDRLPVRESELLHPAGGIVGIIGPNGAGKTTLFRMILGQESPTREAQVSGRPSRSSTSTRDATIARRFKTIWQEISGGAEVIEMGGVKLNSRAYVSALRLPRARPLSKKVVRALRR